MKVETICRACGHSFLLDEKELTSPGGGVPCPGCGEAMTLPGVPVAELSATQSVGSSTMAAAAAAPAVAEAMARLSPAPAEIEEVVCPRCGLHFQPRDGDKRPAVRGDHTILVVDDTEYFRELASETLASKFDVRTADSGELALQMLHQGGIDLLILDVSLERDNMGRELLSRLDPKPCPVLVFTAQDEAEMYGEEWTRLQELGADDMLIKGMQVEESLMRKVCGMLGVRLDDDELE